MPADARRANAHCPPVTRPFRGLCALAGFAAYSSIVAVFFGAPCLRLLRHDHHRTVEDGRRAAAPCHARGGPLGSFEPPHLHTCVLALHQAREERALGMALPLPWPPPLPQTPVAAAAGAAWNGPARGMGPDEAGRAGRGLGRGLGAGWGRTRRAGRGRAGVCWVKAGCGGAEWDGAARGGGGTEAGG